MTCRPLLLTIMLIFPIAAPQIAYSANSNLLIAVEVGQKTYTGKVLAHNDQFCWLLEQDGRVQKLKVADVTSFRKLSPLFRPFPAAEVRTRLLRELGTGFEVKGTTHYLIAAAPGQAERFTELFEQIYREFYVYLSARNFSIPPAESPLVAIVFPTHEQFVKYAQADGIQNTAGLRGYYDVKSHRIAAYDSLTPVSQTGRNSSTTTSSVAARSDTQQDLQETLIHEATHQIAFHLGLHSRIGTNPRWVVEGLAMVFEHPEARSGQKNSSARQRMNHERYQWFGNYARKRRTSESLEALLRGEQPFVAATLDAYSEAWALTFFLMETRPTAYAKYLELMARRDSLKPYRAEERLSDFRTAFGEDLQRLEIDYLRFIENL